MSRFAFVALGALLASACGGEQLHPKLFSTDWQDDQGRSINEVQARLRGAKPAASTDLVVAVGGAKADKILGFPLAGGAPWSFPHALDARPAITGSIVVGAGGGEVFALDASSGKRLWARPTGGLGLIGAGDDGQTTAVLLSKGAGSTTILIVGRDGSVRRQIESDKQLGNPAVVGGIVFVPWQNQYVSAIDAQTGDEIGRVVVRDKVSRALTIGGGLYFGEVGFTRFDEKIGMASRGGASRVGLPSRELPGSPRVLVPGGEKEPAVANARDRDRLYARPSGPEGPLGLDSNRFYAAYYRLVIGFESAKGQLSWVHTHPIDVIGGGAIAGGLLLCDEEGKIVVLDARTGGVAMEKTFGEPIKSCSAHADTFHSPGNQAAGQPIAEQISTAVLNREATLATAQRLLLRELATLEDENATKTLVEIASDPRAAPVLVADARSALAARRNGAQYMLAALGKHYDFLRDVLLPPPVGPIADALAAMKEPKAAPLLASHLMDAADTDDDIKRAAAALAILGTKDELATLRQFFAAYRGTAETDEIALAVASVGEAIMRIDTKDGRATVETATHDPMTSPVAKARLDSLLAAAPATPEKPAPKPPEKK